ncbi:hypothetical protein [Clostridium coskatii]|uniref:Uncharacterized protein n=1 Tax=Clostridium coskatii TaxID=1705578 RepID=A0A166TTA7_9CLOT|nr:hypothetical protein [Clostridium coskatii]OAA94064.1 hypothetical protein WX73_03634 [Clostridium coskatii]OBR96626.1 hypothetical protein CLCOS_07880 [Clostridium coskatii]
MSKFEIDSYVEKLAMNKNVQSFYPVAISKALNLQLNLVLERLNELVSIGYLKLKFEIKCDCNFDTIEIVEDYTKYLGQEVYCEDCGTDVKITLENIFPIYYIEDDYRECVKKKKQHNTKENGHYVTNESNDKNCAISMENLLVEYFKEQGSYIEKSKYGNISEDNKVLGEIASMLSIIQDKEILGELSLINESIKSLDNNQNANATKNSIFQRVVDKADTIGKVHKGCQGINAAYSGLLAVIHYASGKWTAIGPYIKPIKTFIENMIQLK